MANRRRAALQAGFAGAAQGTPTPTPAAPEPPVHAPAEQAQGAPSRPRGRPATDRTAVREKGQPVLLHLHPEFHEALKIACIKTKRRMQDELLAWIEAGARKAGYQEPVRVQADPPK